MVQIWMKVHWKWLYIPADTVTQNEQPGVRKWYILRPAFKLSTCYSWFNHSKTMDGSRWLFARENLKAANNFWPAQLTITLMCSENYQILLSYQRVQVLEIPERHLEQLSWTIWDKPTEIRIGFRVFQTMAKMLTGNTDNPNSSLNSIVRRVFWMEIII